MIGAVTGADPAQRTLAVRRIDGVQLELHYDQLIIALGSVSRTLPIPGLAEHAIGLKSLADATALRNQVLTCFDIAESLEEPARRAEYLGFVFIGAGYAGVEGLAELQDFAAEAIELYPRCRAEGMRWVLVEAGPRIMQEVPESLSQFAERELRGRGIEVSVRTTLSEVSAQQCRAVGRQGDSGSHRGVDGGSQAEPGNRQAWVTAGSRTGAWWWIGRCGCMAGNLSPGAAGALGPSGRSAIAPRFPTPPGRDSRPLPQPSMPFDRGGSWRATWQRRWRAAGCGRFAIGRWGSSPSSDTARRSRSRSAFAGVAFPAWFIARTYHLLLMPGVGRKLRLLADWNVALLFGRDASAPGRLGSPTPLEPTDSRPDTRS